MKGKYLIVSIIITIVLFFLLGYVDKKVLGIDSMQKVLVVKAGVHIEKYEKLDSSMFETLNVPSTLAVNAISDINEIEGNYALSQIFAGDVLKREKFGVKDSANLIEVEQGKRKLAIAVSSLADGVAGQVRENAYVDILFTNNATSKNPNVETIILLEKVKVLGVTDSNGKLINGINAGKISAVILSVSPEDAQTLVNSERKGMFRLVEVSNS